ncbi:uncharacterized protein V1477_021082 [Vespula maculifrons]|uniref:Uncharacterized protein n=1 Tax=Vespula maculifrons TaxID=7453 RepID=A0ABD2AJB6_VESMC
MDEIRNDKKNLMTINNDFKKENLGIKPEDEEEVKGSTGDEEFEGDETLVHFVSSRLSSKFLRSPEEETPRIIYKFSICHDNGNHLLKQDPLVRHSCKAQLLTEGYGTIFATYLTVDGFDVYKLEEIWTNFIFNRDGSLCFPRATKFQGRKTMSIQIVISANCPHYLESILRIASYILHATARELPFLGMQRKTDIVTNTFSPLEIEAVIVKAIQKFILFVTPRSAATQSNHAKMFR